MASSGLPQPGGGFIIALVVLALVIFFAPPKTRLWIVALVVLYAIATKGKQGAALIDKGRKFFYGE
jgi:hypothetical protein